MPEPKEEQLKGAGIQSGTILIREGIALPESLPLESLPWTRGWRILRKQLGLLLDHEVQQAGWEFVFVGNAFKSGAIGSSESAKHRALRGLLGKLGKSRFNAVEVTAVTKGHFLGVPYISIVGHSRHLYESLALSYLRPAVGPKVSRHRAVS